MASAGFEDVLTLEAGALAAAVRGRELDAIEAVSAALKAIEAAADLRAVVTVCGERALERARAGVNGPLAGVPFVCKDLLDTEGVRTAFGSSIHRDRVPTASASAVLRLEAAGAILVGKANLHEFAWGTTSQNPHWGTVGNPRFAGHVAGGSVRIPAACCGTVGFKPRPDTIPRDGCFPLAPSFDTIGWIASTTRECALLHHAAGGPDVRAAVLDGVRVGVLADGPEAANLERLGARLVAAQLPPVTEAAGEVFLAECVATHHDTFLHAGERLGPDVRAKYVEAVRVLDGHDPRAARAALEAWRRAASTALAVDVVVSPAIDGPIPTVDCWEPDVRGRLARWTRPFSLVGWSAIALGRLQIAGRTEAAVLGVALAYEEAFGSGDPADPAVGEPDRPDDGDSAGADPLARR